MAIIKSNTEASDAVPEVWLANAIGALRKKIVMAGLVRRDVRDEPSEKGDTVNVIKRGQITANKKSEGSDISFEAPTNSKIPLTLSEHAYTAWSMEDVASNLAIDDAIDYIDDATDELVAQLEDDILAEYASLVNQEGTAGNDLTVSTILTTRKAMNDNDVPRTDRNFVVSTKDGKNLLGTSEFTHADVRGDQGEALQEASLGRLYGFDFYESNRVPETGSGPVNTHNIAFHPNAFMLGARPLQLPPQGTGVTASYVVDEQTGLALRIMQSYQHASMGAAMSMDLLYGTSVPDDRVAIEVLS